MAAIGFADPSVEVEPNNTCLTAQEITGAAPPGSVLGALSDALSDTGVDFFLFRLVPIQYVRVDLQGQNSGKGTLDDPYLGLFDSACNLLDSNDDSVNLDSSSSAQGAGRWGDRAGGDQLLRFETLRARAVPREAMS